MVNACTAWDRHIVDVGDWATLEDINEQRRDEEPDDKGHGTPDQAIDHARLRLQPAQKDQDGQLDDGQGGIIDQLVDKVPLCESPGSVCAFIDGSRKDTDDQSLLDIIVFRDILVVYPNIVGFDI